MYMVSISEELLFVIVYLCDVSVPISLSPSSNFPTYSSSKLPLASIEMATSVGGV